VNKSAVAAADEAQRKKWAHGLLTLWNEFKLFEVKSAYHSVDIRAE
jgi:hypothetical protein